MFTAHWHEKVIINPTRWFFEAPKYEMQFFSKTFDKYWEAENYLYGLLKNGHDIFLATINEEDGTCTCFHR